MHFHGRSSSITDDRRTIKTTTPATSCTLRTTIGADGVDCRQEAIDGDLAFLESEIQVTGPERFSEKGVITFGENHLLRFSTMEDGHLAPSACPRTAAGAANSKVEGGEGQFAGATGLSRPISRLAKAVKINDYQFWCDLRPVKDHERAGGSSYSSGRLNVRTVLEPSLASTSSTAPLLLVGGMIRMTLTF